MKDNPLVKTFIQLCSIPSPSGKEKKIADFVLTRVKDKVDEVFVDKVGNIYLKILGKNRKFLLYCAHLDTVEPAGEQKIFVEKDFIKGEGKYVLGGDNKVAVAVILDFIENFDRKKAFNNLEVIFSVKEETEGGLRYFPKEKIQAKHALVADLSLPIGKVMTSGSYVGGYAINVSFSGGHVRLLENNIGHPLNFFINFVKKIPFGKINKDTIVNISKVKMGESFNSIPSLLYFSGEIRTYNKKTYENFFKKIKTLTPILDKKFNTQSQLELYPYCLGYKLKDKDLFIIKKVFQKLKIKFKPIRSYSVGDFSILNEWGIKTINIANGNIDAHTVYEKVPVSSLFLLRKIFEEYYFSF
jgi:tripeptide aminopeptidase